MWTRLRAVVPERTGVLILDGTSFPEAGHGLGRRRAAVPAARAARSRIARRRSRSRCGPGRGRGCWARRCICPRRGSRRASGRGHGFPRPCDFAPKWQLALDAAAPGAGGGLYASRRWSAMRSSATTRRCAARCTAPSCPTRWASRPISRSSWGRRSSRRPPPLTGKGRPRTRRRVAARRRRPSKRAPGRPRKRRARGASSRGATARNPPWRARFCAVRVTPAHDWRASDGSRPKSGCSANATWRGGDRVRYYLVDLPPTASLRALVPPRAPALGHRAAVSGTERRDSASITSKAAACPDGNATSCLTAIAYSFLQHERRRRGQTQLTLPQVRAVIQEVLTAHFFMTQPRLLASGC